MQNVTSNQLKLFNMLNIAFKMLVHSRKKLIGMLIGATFSAFMIMQQPSIYQGIADRMVAQIQAVAEPDLWVMRPDSEAFNYPVNFLATDVYRIRSLPGVLWAVQLYRDWMTLTHLKTNRTMPWEIVGVDPVTLIGLPKDLIAGNREAIRQSNSMIVDGYSLKQFGTNAQDSLSIGTPFLDTGKRTWTIVGISKPLRTYMVEPKAYVLSTHLPSLLYRPSFILVKVKPHINIKEVAATIKKRTQYDALTRDEFKKRALYFFRVKTPIMIIFICVAALGFIIGLIIMWQIFSNFILTHLHQFGMLKMLGLSNKMITKMVLFQAFMIGGGGFCLGLLLTNLFGLIFHDTTIAFHLTFNIILLGILGTLIIITLSSLFSILKVLKMDSVELCRDAN